MGRRAVTAGIAALSTALALSAATATATAAAAAESSPPAPPVVSATTPGPVAVAPWLGAAAAGLSGCAVLLAATALAVAFGVRRRVDVADRPAAPEPDGRTAERLQRLEGRVRGLEAAAAPRSESSPTANLPSASPPSASLPAAPPATVAAAAPRAPFPPPAPADPAPPASLRTGRPAGEAPSPPDLAAWTAELTDAFARLARDPSAAAAAFIAAHRPQGAAAGPDGLALVDGFEGAKMWAVRAPVEGEVWALTPGEVAVMNWSAHFASQRAQVAEEVFGAAFDLAAGGGEALRLEAPAMLRRDPASGRLSVRRRGRLSGFRS